MDYASLADDFFVNLNVQTTMKLPTGRETVLHFFEAMQKEFPSMTSFFQRETGEFTLEGDRESGCYCWAEMHSHRICAGYFNPPSLDEAYNLHRWLLQRSIYYLGLSGLDIDAMDVLFGFNLDFTGNRDSIVADALLGDSPLSSFSSDPEVKPVEFEPNIVFALDEECYLQGRVSVETRCSSFQVRTGQFDEEPISVYFTVRQYPSPGGVIDMAQSFARQSELCEEYTSRLVVPQIIQPIAQAIATAQ
ncbi:MAG: hypothetical protein DRP83_08405 [Planctomycetota bacterium]|nr:MAG: hypothetical protein DRP83_08405 [Planctomycetota bacterium]